MDTSAEPTELDAKRSSRRLWRLVALLFATPALLVGGLLGYVWLREHSWTPPAIAEPSPMPDGYARRVALARRVTDEPYALTTLDPGVSRDEALRLTVRSNAAALAQLDEVLRTPCWVPAESAEQSSEKWRALRQLGRALSYQAKLAEADGDIAGAAKACLDGYDLAQSLDQTFAWPKERLYRAGALKPLWRLVERMDGVTARTSARRFEALLTMAPSEAQVQLWTAPSLAARLAETMGWPRPWRAGFVQYRLAEGRITQAEAVAEGVAAHWGYAADWHDYIGAPSPRERHRQVMSLRTAEAREWQKPLVQQRRVEPAGRQWAARLLAAGDTAGALFSSRTAADRLLLTNLALRAYRVDHGRYPDRLADLVPDYLRQVPEDPMDGASLRYRRDGDGFLCWSVGPDFQDDDGRRIERGDKRSPADGLIAKCGDVGDIVSP